jgi:cytochrome b6-f complex iron-sulfur subunit
MNRRDVIQRVVLGGTVLVLVPSVLQSCTKDSTTDPNNNPGGNTGGNTAGTKITIDLSLADNSALNSIGGSKIVQSILVVNTSGGYIALSSVCTHQGCTVAYVSSAGNIQCPCHGSMFSTSGSVTNGPAPTSLQSYPVSKSGNVLTISL